MRAGRSRSAPAAAPSGCRRDRSPSPARRGTAPGSSGWPRPRPRPGQRAKPPTGGRAACRPRARGRTATGRPSAPLPGAAPAPPVSSTCRRAPPSAARARAATSPIRAGRRGYRAAAPGRRRPRWDRGRGAPSSLPGPGRRSARRAPSRGSAPASQTGVARVRAAAERLDLPLEPLDLERFLGPYERVPVQARRRVALAGWMVGGAQIVEDGRIPARQLDRSLELLDGALVLAALVVHPAQAVDVDGVVRLPLEGAADHAVRLASTSAP